MSNLLEQASLVMIPSGYKEDIVYSEIPINGAGDLSFTRASDGTRINSQGLVEVTPWNLLQYSETFNVSPWTNEGNTVTNNSIVAPNGTTTADTISNSATTALFRTYQGPITGYSQPQTLTFSTYFKYKDHRYISFGLTDDSDYRSQVVVDLQNMVITENYKFFSGDVLTSSIESVGDGWYRIVGTFTYNTALAGGNLYFLYKFQTSGTFNPVGTYQTGTGFYMWGAQLNIGSTAKPYFPTTDRLNVPRLTYQNGGCPSLLLEKQSTNLVTYSEQFDDSSWGKSNSTITANNTTSPDGTQNADKFEASGSGVITHALTKGVVTTLGTVYASSLYAKKGSTDWIMMRHDNGGSLNYFNLNTGTKGATCDASATIESVGNGWYRLTVFHTGTLLNGSEIYLATANGGNAFEASGQYVYIWGAQYEASSYPTSYIPTTSSSATRVADACFKTGISSLFGASATSFFMDFEITQVSSGGNWTITGYDGSNLFSLCQFDTASNFPRIVFDGGVDTTLGTALSIGRHKIAVSFATNDFRAYIDGVLVLTDTSCTYNRYDRIAVNGTAWTGNTNNTNSFKLNEYAQFPNVLTNAELQAITTL